MLVDRYLFDQPNGLCFSPDEKLLYVNDTVQTLIRVFDVAADGSLSNGRMFASGIRSSLGARRAGRHEMRCPRQCLGHGPRRHLGLRAVGDLIGKVRVPELVANLSWGGADFRTLFMTATHSVYTRDDQGRAAQRALYERDAAAARPLGAGDLAERSRVDGRGPATSIRGAAR